MTRAELDRVKVFHERKMDACAALLAAGMDPDAVTPSGPVELEDGTFGWCVREPRTDDCFAAVLATCLQVPIADVPDPRLDERLAAGETIEEINRLAYDELERWLATRRLRMVLHRQVPAARRRWIGIVPMPGPFNDHCLVMSRDRVLFDPTCAIPGVRVFDASDVGYGLSFTQIPNPRSRRNGA